MGLTFVLEVKNKNNKQKQNKRPLIRNSVTGPLIGDVHLMGGLLVGSRLLVLRFPFRLQGVKELEHLNETGELKSLLQNFEVSWEQLELPDTKQIRQQIWSTQLEYI